MNNNPIAVFDSGLGGLSVWKEIVRALPEESIMYYGDGANCPYGGKSQAEIIRLSEAIVRFLLDRGAKLIVVACNTATAGAISYLRAHYAVPFVGMEPAVKPAAEHSETGVIAILATAGTLKGKLFTETSQRFSAGVKILTRIGEGFVELIETGRANSTQAEEAVRRTVEPLLAQGVDRLVLGCTHYPFLAETLRRVIGDRPVELIDPAPAIARRVKEVLTERNELAEAGHLAKYDYFSSGDEAYRGRLQEYGEHLLLGIKEENEHGKK
ncbi:MAG: glutamate racemase [Rikenellaceae bacterium]|jgi:glutamate racemase|nr:glutamate racemase [Rikenellaceae bacterium]